MGILRLCLLVLITLGWILNVPSLGATVRGTEVFLPSIGCGDGLDGASWSSTLWVHNPSESAANVQFFFLLRDQPNPSPQVYNDTIASGQTKLFTDPMTLMFGTCEFGAIRVLSDRSLVVNSRIHSRPEGGRSADTLGQGFEAIPAGFAIGRGQRSSVLGVSQSATDSPFRFNFGFVETTGAGADVKVTAIDGSGNEMVSATYALGGWEARQLNMSVLMPSVDSNNLRLEFEVISDSGRIIAFGSGIANGSNDAVTFKMELADVSHHPVIGSWFGNALPDSPETSPFPEVVMIPTFFADGTFIANDSVERNNNHGTAHGNWYVRDDGVVDATMYWLNMTDDVTTSGHHSSFKARMVVSISPDDPNALQGTLEGWFFPPDWNPAEPGVEGIPVGTFTIQKLRRLLPVRD